MAKKVTHGSGITAREYVAWDMTGNTPDDQEAAMDWLESVGQAIEQKGLFGAETEFARTVCEAILEGKDRGTLPEGNTFARKILQQLKVVDQSIADSATEQAAKFAFMAGILWGQATIKWEHEPAWDVGIVTTRQRKEGGAATRKGSTAERLEVYRKYRKMGLNKTDASDQASKELNVSIATIRSARKEADASD